MNSRPAYRWLAGEQMSGQEREERVWKSIKKKEFYPPIIQNAQVSFISLISWDDIKKCQNVPKQVEKLFLTFKKCSWTLHKWGSIFTSSQTSLTASEKTTVSFSHWCKNKVFLHFVFTNTHGCAHLCLCVCECTSGKATHVMRKGCGAVKGRGMKWAVKTQPTPGRPLVNLAEGGDTSCRITRRTFELALAGPLNRWHAATRTRGPGRTLPPRQQLLPRLHGGSPWCNTPAVTADSEAPTGSDFQCAKSDFTFLCW